MLDAYAIWLHARAAVTSAPYPARLDYTIAITGLDGQSPTSDHYRASSDTSNGSVRVFPISDEQLAKPPPLPHGINFSINAAICLGYCWVIHQPIGHPAPYQDLIGEPLLEPTYMFGLRYSIPQKTTQQQDEATTLRTIAVVSTRAPVYRVELIDQPELGGVATYHLRLTPLRKPKENRLRELWVGANDYLPRRAVTAGNFTISPLTSIPWTVDFTVLNGAPFLSKESAGRDLFLGHRRIVRDATIAFEDIREPSGSIYDRPLVAPEATNTTLVEPAVP
ncbi:MAG TPA: hypothetical protein VHS56_05220 [Candidatus Cybelea sp.]|nr:hypothetical protein [Candidatus Cybelea sp.]